MSETTEHVTGIGEIMFMAVARPLKNQKTGQDEYSIKIKVDENEPVIGLLKDCNPKRIDNETNRGLAGSGTLVLNFHSNFEVAVVNSEGQQLTGNDIPFFDGRVDTGKANVSFKVIDYGKNKIVRLSGVVLQDLQLTEREDSDVKPLDVTVDLLKSIGK